MIEAALETITKQKEEFINEDEACALLNISKKTIINKVSSGEIPRSYYSIGVGNKRFYNSRKLMGLE